MIFFHWRPCSPLHIQLVIPLRRFRGPYDQFNNFEHGRISGMNEAGRSYRGIYCHLHCTETTAENC